MTLKVDQGHCRWHNLISHISLAISGLYCSKLCHFSDIQSRIMACHWKLVFLLHFLSVPCGRLSWLSVSLLLHAKYTVSYRIYFLPCDAMYSAAIAGMRCPSICPSVRLSVTFVSCAKTNKDIFEIFAPSGSQAILVFPHQKGWRYSDGNSPNGGVECKGVWKNWRFSTNISLYLRKGYS